MKKKSVIILGASSDIGSSVIKRFVNKGWFVYAHYNKNKKNLVKQKYSSSQLKMIKANFNFKKDINKILKFIKNKKINSYINMIGYLDNKSFLKSRVEDKIKSLVINVLGPLEILKQITKNMEKNKFGRILNISSIGVKYGGSDHTYNYSLSKHTLEYLPSYFKKLTKKNILTNNLRIGVVKTKLLKKVKGKNISKRIKLIPIKRSASTQEVSKIIFDLSSDSNSYVSGQTISIAGGE